MWPADKMAYFISQNVTYLKPVYIDEPYHIRFECTNVDHKRMIGTIVLPRQGSSPKSIFPPLLYNFLYQPYTK